VSNLWAHTAIEGIDALYNGILHPLIVPAHLLGLLALGLLTGQQGELQIQRVLPIFLVPLFVALLYVALGGVLIVEQLLLLWAILCGSLVALKLSLPRWLLWACLVGEGLLIGLDSVPMGLEGKDRFALLFGIFLGAGLFLMYLAMIVQRLVHPWQQIGVRVLGSWIIASSLLVLTLSIVQSSSG
jgi:urease accessory protein